MADLIDKTLLDAVHVAWIDSGQPPSALFAGLPPAMRALIPDDASTLAADLLAALSYLNSIGATPPGQRHPLATALSNGRLILRGRPDGLAAPFERALAAIAPSMRTLSILGAVIDELTRRLDLLGIPEDYVLAARQAAAPGIPPPRACKTASEAALSLLEFDEHLLRLVQFFRLRLPAVVELRQWHERALQLVAGGDGARLAELRAGLPAQPAEPLRVLLMFRFSPVKGDPDHYVGGAWRALCTGAGVHLLTERVFPAHQEHERALHRSELEQVIRTVYDALDPDLPRAWLSIEVFLPRRLIGDLCPEDVDIRDDMDDSRLLGELVPIVLRAHERTGKFFGRDARRTKWSLRTKPCAVVDDLPAADGDLPLAICFDQTSRDDAAAIQARAAAGCVLAALILGPPHRGQDIGAAPNDVLNVLLRAGVPIILWTPMRPTTPEVLADIRSVLHEKNLDGIPRVIHERRKVGKAGRGRDHVTVLFDGPDGFPPPDVPLVVPGGGP